MPWKHSRFIPRTTDSSYFLSQSTSRDPSITFPMPLQRRRLAPVPAQQGHSLTANDDLHYNFQVTDYLKKKGFTKTEAIFRQETAYLGPDGRPAQRNEDPGPKKYLKSFVLLKNWIENNLDIYKVCQLPAHVSHGG